MNILKPQKILFNNLRKIENLIEEINICKEIDNVSVENYKEYNANFSMASIENILFTNSSLRNSTFQENKFMHIIVEFVQNMKNIVVDFVQYTT